MITTQDRVKLFIKETIPYVLIIVFVLFLRAFIFMPVLVHGESMSPTLSDNDFLIINKMDHSYERFDIVVFKYNNERLIKRVIGLPGEKISVKNQKVYINDEELDDPLAEITYDYPNGGELDYLIIPEGHYFVMGDNRNNSIDSRNKNIGPVSEERIEGTLGFRLFPFKGVENKYKKN